VGVSSSVCAAVEKFLQRHLIRPPPLSSSSSSSSSDNNNANNANNANNNNNDNNKDAPPPYLPTWRMEALLSDLSAAIDHADFHARHPPSLSSRRNTLFGDLGKDDGNNNEEEDDDDRKKEMGYEVAGPSLTLFVLNPRRTFVSNYKQETYG
jgi:hypothetical protein